MQGDFCVGFKIEKVSSLSSVLQEKIMYYQTIYIRNKKRRFYAFFKTWLVLN